MRRTHQEQSGSGTAMEAGAGEGESLERRVERLEQAIAEERRLRAQAESANRSKDEFLSVVSHELRSPLNAILGWNRILAVKRANDAEVAAITPRIEQSARAQLKMVNDLLDFGRIGTGKLRVSLRQTKLSTLAAMSVDAARPAADAKGVSLSLEPCAAAMVVADPDRLMQVIANLLSNATKFTPRGGQVVVRVREAGESVQLSVVDTGQGIEPDLLPHVFDRFTQGDSSTTRSVGGLGLGLTLAREIVALHGGRISAQSEGTGHGSTFTVTLPSAHAEAQPSAGNGSEAVEAPGSRPRRLGGLSILVVDDEADARTVVAEALRLEGASVAIGDSVASALAQLRDPGRHFDVLVTDIGMPEEDGYSLVRKLRRLPAGEKTVVIALTGYASRSDVEAAIDAGFDLHVPKPVDFDSFVPLIRRLASQHA